MYTMASLSLGRVLQPPSGAALWFHHVFLSPDLNPPLNRYSFIRTCTHTGFSTQSQYSTVSSTSLIRVLVRTHTCTCSMYYVRTYTSLSLSVGLGSVVNHSKFFVVKSFQHWRLRRWIDFYQRSRATTICINTASKIMHANTRTYTYTCI